MRNFINKYAYLSPHAAVACRKKRARTPWLVTASTVLPWCSTKATYWSSLSSGLLSTSSWTPAWTTLIGRNTQVQSHKTNTIVKQLWTMFQVFYYEMNESPHGDTCEWIVGSNAGNAWALESKQIAILLELIHNEKIRCREVDRFCSLEAETRGA